MISVERMNLKGTKSEKNIKAALTGESLARNKYTFYAMHATYVVQLVLLKDAL